MLYCHNGEWSAVCLGNGELFRLRLGPNGTNYNQLKDHPNRKQHFGLGAAGRRGKYVVSEQLSHTHTIELEAKLSPTNNTEAQTQESFLTLSSIFWTGWYNMNFKCARY